MDYIHFLALVFSCEIFHTSPTIALNANSLSCSVMTHYNRRLNGSTFKTFHAVSLVLCGLRCQRHPRCVSLNFRTIFSFDEANKAGVCEFNERAAVALIAENEDLEYDEESVYIQFNDVKVSEVRVLLFSIERTNTCV